MNTDIQTRVNKLSKAAKGFFDTAIKDGEANPHKQLEKIRTALTDRSIPPELMGAAQLALVKLTADSRVEELPVQITDEEARISYEAAIAASEKTGDTGRAEFLRGILDRLDSKAEADKKRAGEVAAKHEKEAETNLAAAQEQYEKAFEEHRLLEIEHSMKGKMTLESAERFFEQHQRPNLERSLKATYGLPA